MGGERRFFSHKIFQRSFFLLDSKNSIDSALEGINQSVSEKDNKDLTKPFSKAEIEVALNSMNPTKASGSDDMHTLFYQTYWEIVGEDTSKICLDILNGHTSAGSVNKSFIALIPKTKDPKEWTNFRPISLCNVIYKIVAKVLTKRMKNVLEKIISPTQATFVPNRLISDNVIIGFECIHHLNNRRKGKTGYIAMKLDMNKAYDRVEWSYIRRLMEKMGFAGSWIAEVMDCVKSIRYSVLINRVS